MLSPPTLCPHQRPTAAADVFVQPRKLLDVEVNALPSPSLWSHAFGPSPSQAGSPSQLGTDTSSSDTGGDLAWLGDSDSDIDDAETPKPRNSTLPRMRPRVKYTFAIGNQQHETFSSAIAALMTCTSPDTNLATESVTVKTPSDFSGRSPRKDEEEPIASSGGNYTTNLSSAALPPMLLPVRTPSAPTCYTSSDRRGERGCGNGGGPRALSARSLPDPIVTTLSPTSLKFTGLPALMLSADAAVERKGRFEVRKL
ncbi:hypothetical protein HDU81_008754 [Chytriomyces hyalinus]|nr:hypothetical protein HDU81_008754 [Chytriomyces hyalinus]